MPESIPASTSTQWDGEGRLEVLTFNLGEETFALEATLVREILDLLPETRVPGAAQWPPPPKAAEAEAAAAAAQAPAAEID